MSRSQPARPRGIVAWSSGKDSAFALHEVRRAGAIDIVGLLTTITAPYGRVSMHGVRKDLLDAQAAALGLPVFKVLIPSPCSNEVYLEKMAAATAALRTDGVSRVVFGDLFLEDVRDYRIGMLEGTGIDPVFPLWGRNTRALADDMLAAGLEAWLTCVDPRVLDRDFAGRRFNAEFLDSLPENVDACGENGEFHTVVTKGPMFDRAIAVTRGKRVTRDGFVFADFMPL